MGILLELAQDVEGGRRRRASGYVKEAQRVRGGLPRAVRWAARLFFLLSFGMEKKGGGEKEKEKTEKERGERESRD